MSASAVMEQAGRLSASEAARLSDGSRPRVRAQLADELKQSEAIRDVRLAAMHERFEEIEAADLLVIHDYADAYARVILARRALEACFP